MLKYLFLNFVLSVLFSLENCHKFYIVMLSGL
nr:MAG TPA: hypothetical protein [Caudoviricetes sp.]